MIATGSAQHRSRRVAEMKIRRMREGRGVEIVLQAAAGVEPRIANQIGAQCTGREAVGSVRRIKYREYGTRLKVGVQPKLPAAGKEIKRFVVLELPDLI